MEEIQTEPNEEIATVIDYSNQFNSIESALERIEDKIETVGSESYFESNGISLLEGKTNLTDILTALIFIIISLGLILGAVVFQHFRK